MELILGTRDGLDVSSSGMFRGIPASPVHEKVSSSLAVCA